MASKTLAVIYRPQTFEDMTEQESIKIILKEQLKTGEIKNAYLFCGPSGCGKTTISRIFANEINKGKGSPIEMDAASNSGVDDVRNIIQQAKAKSLDSEYKVFIIDEAHSISNTGWQAFLKLIEEPPAKTIFIFATTNPEKIPRTILSRVQRYDFKVISQQGIVNRLRYILQQEYSNDSTCDTEVLEYIAQCSEGHMRDAISYMEKCQAFGELTLENVVKVLGTVDYEVMKELTDNVLKHDIQKVIKVVEDIYMSGKDIKQFVNQYVRFLLDVQKFGIGCDWKYIQLPALEDNKKWLDNLSEDDFDVTYELLGKMIKLNSDIKWSQTPKYDLEAVLLLLCMEE